MRITSRLQEAQAVLIINTQAILPPAVAFERLQPIAGQKGQIPQRSGVV
jgi:hypothetical protein